MSNLNYVPSWLDSAMTLLEKLNKCIEKIETIVNTVVSVTKTANDALSLANSKSSKLYLHEISITLSDFTVRFKKINSESEPINNYEGEQQNITNGGFDFSASGSVAGGITCNTQVGDAHFVITYGKISESAFSELTYNNTFYFMDRDGALNNVTSVYKDGTPSAFTDTVTEL